MIICDLSEYQTMISDTMEYCGFFIHEEPLCLIHDSNQLYTGTSVSLMEKRLSCHLPRYRSIIWHTHPYISKGYPSAEDIVKVLKNANILTSIIFTIWGIWQLDFSKSYPELAEETIKKQWINYIDTKISPPLYFGTEKGRVLQILSQHERYINDYIRSLEIEYPGLQIWFTTWQNLPHGVYNLPFYVIKK